MSRFIQLSFVTGTSSLEELTKQFITATGLSNKAQIKMINNLVKGLTANSLLEDFVAVYPFVGTSLEAYSYNLLNTTKYKLQWGSTTEYYSDGVMFHTTDTKTGIPFSVVSSGLNQNFTVGYYSKKTVSQEATVDVYSTPAGTNFTIYNYGTGNQLRVDFGNTSTAHMIVSVSSADGLKMLNVKNGNASLYLRGTSILSKTLAAVTITGDILLNYTNKDFDNRNKFGVVCVGKGLTNGKAVVFNSLFSEFLTALGR